MKTPSIYKENKSFYSIISEEEGELVDYSTEYSVALAETDNITDPTQKSLEIVKVNQEWIGAIAAYEEGISHLPEKSLKKKMLQKLLKMPAKFIST